MKVTVRYITKECVLIYFDDYWILFNTPPISGFIEIAIDWSLVDLIILSDWRFASSVVYLSEYTRFRGKIFATIPTIEFAKLCLFEYVYANEVHEYSAFDVEEGMSKVKPVFFNAPLKISPNLSITATSSGMTLGGTNWVINYGSTKIVCVSDWAREGHPYARLIDIDSVKSADLLINARSLPLKKILYNRKLRDLFPKIEQTLKANSTVLFPTATIDDLFGILEELHHLLDSAGLQRPIHLLSRTGKNAILNASIFSEWMTKERQAKAVTAQQPILPSKLLDNCMILCHESLDQVLHYAEPRLIVVTKEFSLPILFQSLDLNACVIVSDPSFMVPSSRVFYYDQPERDLEIKPFIETLKPKNICMENADFDFEMNVSCSLPWKVLREEMVDSLYIPIPQAQLDLANNHITY